MIRKFDVTSQKAFDYIKEQLDLSGKTMANSILQLPLENGKIYSFAPENTPEKELHNFEYGVLYPYDKNTFNNSIHQPDGSLLVPLRNDAGPVVINTIIEYLKSNNQHCCLFEEATSSPSDPWVKKEQIRYSYLNKEIYYFFNGDVDEVEFEEDFKTSQGYYFLCALSRLSQNEQSLFIPYQEISLHLIRSFTVNLTSFFVRAYDGEGFLEWHT